MLIIDDHVLFESAVILEYLEETLVPKLHPNDPLRRADHRACIEFGSTILADIAAFYRAPDAETFERKRLALRDRFAPLESRAVAKTWFDGPAFSLVGAVFGPVFRYFDLVDAVSDFGILADKPKIARWRKALAQRPPVQEAVSPDYPERLKAFIGSLDSHLARLMAPTAAAAH